MAEANFAPSHTFSVIFDIVSDTFYISFSIIDKVSTVL